MAFGEGLKGLNDLLRATWLQALALAIACWGFIYATRVGLVPAPEPWVLQLAAFLGLLSAALWVLLAGHAVWRGASAGVRNWSERRQARKQVAAYIPYMTEQEREIIGCLLERNQKSFTCALDGGHATTLIARGIVVQATRPGRTYDTDDIPMVIPEDVWKVLDANREEFPQQHTGEIDPWRVHWMAR